jgi:hypothetical protein
MPVSDQAVMAAWALLLGDTQEAAALIEKLGDADMLAYELLLQAVLSLVAGQRFAPSYADGDVIRFIARIRAGTDVRIQDLNLDPKAAEAVLRQALGQPVSVVKDGQSRMRAIVALLTTMLDESSLTQVDLDPLLAKARELADGWLLETHAT